MAFLLEILKLAPILPTKFTVDVTVRVAERLRRRGISEKTDTKNKKFKRLV